jgi:hypothetical protein
MEEEEAEEEGIIKICFFVFHIQYHKLSIERRKS